jgi:hypothetical protein
MDIVLFDDVEVRYRICLISKVGPSPKSQEKGARQVENLANILKAVKSYATVEKLGQGDFLYPSL